MQNGNSIPETMKAVVLKAPFDIKIEQRPTPKIEKCTDVIIKVHQAGLCGMSPINLLTLER